MTAVMLILGLVMLVAGGHVLVLGADGLARAIGLSPLVVGLTVVSFATSAPELAVTVDASLSGSPGLAVGNVVGSNMANILLVLGVAGLILPLTVRTPVIRRDIPVMIGLSVLLLIMSVGGRVSQLEGAGLLGLLLAYVAWTIVRSRQAGDTDAADPEAAGEGARERTTTVPVGILYVAGGVALLVVGARWLVSAASDIAVDLGVSELVVGLTVVALGTSLPELATSVIAAIRGEIEMAVGNVVGSNIFNIGSVMAVTALVTPGGVPVEASAVRFDLPLMLAVALALLPIAFTGFVVARWEAALFTLYYVAYGAYLLLDSTAHDALPGFSVAMLGFVMPITALTLIVFATFEAGVRKGRREEAAARAR
jgi:cation:H+ antiporter